jgi:Iap family predicted aminopeptidase
MSPFFHALETSSTMSYHAQLKLLIGLALFAGCLAGCQQPRAAVDDRLLVGEVMTNSELPANLRAICMPGGRLSGSENAHDAERYVAEKLREYGLADVHLEPFEMTTWRDRKTVVTLLDDTPVRLEGALALGNTLSTPHEGRTAELVNVGTGTEEEFEAAAADLPGRFALTFESGRHRGAKMTSALEYGAAGMVQVSRLDDRARVGTCHKAPRHEPGVVILRPDGEALAERLEAGETVRLNIKVLADAWDVTPNNVVGEIPGRGPTAHELVLVTAHLDSWHLAEGAIDNGNGAACILEIARALSAIDWQPRRTVRFVWFMGEEHGLYGSKAYVEAHQDELDDIVAVLNVDMPGRPQRFGHFGHEEIEPFLLEMRERLVGFDISDEIRNASWTASDHAAFMKQGVCAIGLWGPLGDGVKFYHSTGDTYDVVDLAATNQAAAAMSVVVKSLADAPERPTVRKEPQTDDD